MMDALARGLENHFMTAILVSGALALLIVAGVGLAWAGGRRWVRARGIMARPGNWQTMRFSGERDAPRPSEGERRHGDDPGTPTPEQPGGRFMREAATRAANLREAWDRSYREARGAPADPGRHGANQDLESLIQALLREQRETNDLLRQLLKQQEPPNS